MSTLSEIYAHINANGSILTSVKDTLKKCFMQAVNDALGTVTSITVDSPHSTVTVTNPTITTNGTIDLDITGTPPTDNTTALGSPSKRWTGVIVVPTGSIAFISGGNSDRIAYAHGTGPTFFDSTSGATLKFNLQAGGATQTATWQNSSGTVAWLTDLATSTTQPPGTSNTTVATTEFVIQNESNTLTVFDSIAGGQTISPTQNAYTRQIVAFDIGGTVATLTVVLPDGMFDGQDYQLTFSGTVTALTLNGTFLAPGSGLAKPTTAADTSFGFTWDVVTATPAWRRYR